MEQELIQRHKYISPKIKVYFDEDQGSKEDKIDTLLSALENLENLPYPFGDFDLHLMFLSIRDVVYPKIAKKRYEGKSISLKVFEAVVVRYAIHGHYVKNNYLQGVQRNLLSQIEPKL